MHCFYIHETCGYTVIALATMVAHRCSQGSPVVSWVPLLLESWLPLQWGFRRSLPQRAPGEYWSYPRLFEWRYFQLPLWCRLHMAESGSISIVVPSCIHETWSYLGLESHCLGVPYPDLWGWSGHCGSNAIVTSYLGWRHPSHGWCLAECLHQYYLWQTTVMKTF